MDMLYKRIEMHSKYFEKPNSEQQTIIFYENGYKLDPSSKQEPGETNSIETPGENWAMTLENQQQAIIEAASGSGAFALSNMLKIDLRIVDDQGEHCYMLERDTLFSTWSFSEERLSKTEAQKVFDAITEVRRFQLYERV